MSASRLFDVTDETPAPPDPSATRAAMPDDLVVHAVMVSGDAHKVAGQINAKLSQFIGGILGIQFIGINTAVVLIRATRAQIEAAKRGNLL